MTILLVSKATLNDASLIQRKNMNAVVDKVVSHINDILNQSSFVMKNKNADMLGNMQKIVQTINKLSTQIGFKYTYDYSILYIDVLDFIKNASGHMNNEDIEIIQICRDNLSLIFTSESKNQIDSTIYESTLRRFNLSVQKYFKTTPLEHNTLNTSIGLLQEKFPLLELPALMKKYKNNIQASFSNIKLQSNILLKIQSILDEIIIYIYENQKIPKDNIAQIKIYQTQGRLHIDTTLDDMKIDFEDILKKLKALGIMSDNHISQLNQEEIFNILVSGKYFDNNELFLPLKKIKMQSEILSGDMSYSKSENFETISVSFYCDFIASGFNVEIKDTKYFIQEHFIYEIVPLKQTSIQGDTIISNNEEIKIVSNYLLSMEEPDDNGYAIILESQNEKFAFYCDNIYESIDIKINSLSRNLPKKLSFVLGLYVQESQSLIAIDVIDIGDSI